MRKASIVIGLGFGDEGKGLTTDYLCSLDEDTLVVRFSGGQQAGHTVILDGVKHVCSNFGSGTLRGMPSYFSEHCSVYLNTIKKEKEVLQSKGIHEPVLYVHPLTKITTPWDIAYGRVREKIYGHGSVGLGIGATMTRHNTSGYKLFAYDLYNQDVLHQKLVQIETYYTEFVPDYLADFYFEILDKEVPEFYELAARMPFKIKDYSLLTSYGNVVFEGSQGVMLDMDHGIFPHVTYANTTSKNAIDICKIIDIRPKLFYVTRCYQTRHGNGWMSNSKEINLINTDHEINKFNEWQKHFRVRELDYELLNYAIGIDQIYSGEFNASLVVTCLDQRPKFEFDYEKITHQFKSYLTSNSPESKGIIDHGNIKKKATRHLS